MFCTIDSDRKGSTKHVRGCMHASVCVCAFA